MQYTLVIEPIDNTPARTTYQLRSGRLLFSAKTKKDALALANIIAGAADAHSLDKVEILVSGTPKITRDPKDTPVRRNLYRRWHAMIRRCYDPKSDGYKMYGAKGATVCDEWRASFAAFLQWALDAGFSPGLSIDRVDNAKAYSPDNCRWATAREQANNMRSNVIIEFAGKSQTLAQWGREVGLPNTTLEQRIRVLKWPIEKAMTTPHQGWGPPKRSAM